MFPWRTFLSIVAFALVLAFYATDISHHKSAEVVQAIQDKRSEDASMNAFGARLPPVARDLEYDSGLHKRDVCNDTFPGRFSQTCAPSRTLCCIIPGEQRPACTNILGFGFCCTENTDCFVDLKSACDQGGSVECATDLCCPAQTTCVKDFNYTATNLVRCNVNRNLIPGYTPSSSSATPRPTGSRAGTRTPASATSESTTGGPENTDSDDGGLSGGAIAGIVIGAVGGVALLALAGFFMLRRRRNNKAAVAPEASQPSFYPYAQGQPPQDMTGVGNGLHEAPSGAEYYTPQGQPKDRYAHVEMPTQERPSELA